MSLKIHFISGLPRSGSTLLAAVLRQNPALHARVSTPLADLVERMSAHQGSLFISAEQRERMLRGIIESYYLERSQSRVIFDANLICCIRNPAWILDSLERAVRSNPSSTSVMFGHRVSNVYQRAEVVMKERFVSTGRRSMPSKAHQRRKHRANARFLESAEPPWSPISPRHV
jgi:sulfotransferase